MLCFVLSMPGAVQVAGMPTVDGETQVLLRFVTQLPQELRVPDTEVVRAPPCDQKEAPCPCELL